MFCDCGSSEHILYYFCNETITVDSRYLDLAHLEKRLSRRETLVPVLIWTSNIR